MSAATEPRLEREIADLRAIVLEMRKEQRDDTKSLRTDLMKVALEVAEVKGRISQLPTTIQMLGFVLAVLAITGAIRVFAP